MTVSYIAHVQFPSYPIQNVYDLYPNLALKRIIKCSFIDQIGVRR